MPPAALVTVVSRAGRAAQLARGRHFPQVHNAPDAWRFVDTRLDEREDAFP